MIEDALCSDLLNPLYTGSEEELGMHVMSQLAQLADLRDLLLNRQPVHPPPPHEQLQQMNFLSEDQIEEWYVSVSETTLDQQIIIQECTSGKIVLFRWTCISKVLLILTKKKPVLN